MAVSARFKVYDIDKTDYSQSVKLTPVYDSDPTSPNYSFSQATPSGNIQLSITNPAAFEQFDIDKVFDITFTEYVAPAPVVTEVVEAPPVSEVVDSAPVTETSGNDGAPVAEAAQAADVVPTTDAAAVTDTSTPVDGGSVTSAGDVGPVTQ